MVGKIKEIDLKGLRLVLDDKRSFWIRPTHSDIVISWQKSQTVTLQENSDNPLYPIVLMNEQAQCAVQAQLARC